VLGAQRIQAAFGVAVQLVRQLFHHTEQGAGGVLPRHAGAGVLAAEFLQILVDSRLGAGAQHEAHRVDGRVASFRQQLIAACPDLGLA
jgi:hypothetical protein